MFMFPLIESCFAAWSPLPCIYHHPSKKCIWAHIQNIFILDAFLMSCVKLKYIFSLKNNPLVGPIMKIEKKIHHLNFYVEKIGFFPQTFHSEWIRSTSIDDGEIRGGSLNHICHLFHSPVARWTVPFHWSSYCSQWAVVCDRSHSGCCVSRLSGPAGETFSKTQTKRFKPQYSFCYSPSD